MFSNYFLLSETIPYSNILLNPYAQILLTRPYQIPLHKIEFYHLREGEIKLHLIHLEIALLFSASLVSLSENILASNIVINQGFAFVKDFDLK